MAYTSRAGGMARTQTAMSDINVTPLVDVVLVLLLIFMLTAPVLQSGIEVAIPHTRSTAVLTEERVVVTIDKDQNVFPAGARGGSGRERGKPCDAAADEREGSGQARRLRARR